MSDKIQLRRDTATNWTTNNPVLAIGEPGLETDTGKWKTGDGATAWTSLSYMNTTALSTIYSANGNLAGNRHVGTSTYDLSIGTATTSLAINDSSASIHSTNSELVVRDTGVTTVKGNTIRLLGNGDIEIANLPTSAPTSSNRLWNDGGVLKITS